jgi:radical SAM protein with 4Fe4S-binding SPASM domain
VIKENSEMSYYILSPDIQLCGYSKLPFGIYNTRIRKTEFLNREQFAILLECDGSIDIDKKTLSENVRGFFNHNIANKNILPCEKGQELRKNQKYQYYDNQFKNSVQWSITGKCNYRCKHCFMSANVGKFGEPSLEQCIKIVGEMADCGIKQVSITGGEPLIRQDFWQIIDELIKHNIVITTIYTNGALVNKALVDGLKSRKIKPSFQISYDGPGWHDWLRGIDGAEEMALNAFRLLREYNIPTSSSMVLHKRNINTIRDTVRILHDVGCSSLKINVASPTGQWIDQPEYFISNEDGFEQYLKYIPQYFEDGTPIDIMLDGAFHYNTNEKCFSIPFDKGAVEKYDNVPVCGSLRENMYLSPEGVVIPCMCMIDEKVSKQYPNAFRTLLKEILTESSYTRAMTCKVSEYMAHNPECVTCRYTYNCKGGCRAGGTLGGGDYLAPDMKTCLYFKNGWFERFKAVGGKFEKNQ